MQISVMSEFQSVFNSEQKKRRAYLRECLIFQFAHKLLFQSEYDDVFV